MLNLDALYRELDNLYGHAGRDAESFGRLQTSIERGQRELQHTFEEMTAEFAERLLTRLRRPDAPIGAEDARLLRSWITGDAPAGDLREDDVLLDRLGELQATLDDLGEVRNEKLSLENLDRVRRLLHRAARVTPEIVASLEHGERVRRLEEALGDDPTRPNDRASLAEMLAERLQRSRQQSRS